MLAIILRIPVGLSELWGWSCSHVRTMHKMKHFPSSEMK